MLPFTYLNGQPCENGHVATRYRHNNKCIICYREEEYERRWRGEKPKLPFTIPLSIRQQAMELGLKRYSTGEPCSRGHICERRVKDFSCVECYRLRRRWAKSKGKRYRGNPITVATSKRNRKIKRRGASGSHTQKDLRNLYETQGGKCPYCKITLTPFGVKPHNRHVDHMLPLSMGGSNGPENLQILCGPCNMTKGTMDHTTYLKLHSIEPGP